MKHQIQILCGISLCMLCLIGAGCSSRLKYTSKDKLIGYYEDAGYTVTESDSIDTIEDIHNIYAVKEDSYAQVCYGVPEDKCETVNLILNRLHPDNTMCGYNAGKGIVYCFSSSKAYEISGFQNPAISIETEPITLDPIKVEPIKIDSIDFNVLGTIAFV